MCPDLEDVVYVAEPVAGLVGVCVDVVLYKICHVDVSEGWDKGVTHHCALYLEIVLVIKDKVVVFKSECDGLYELVVSRESSVNSV